MERLLDVAGWLTASNQSANGIPQLRDLIREIHTRLMDDINQV